MSAEARIQLRPFADFARVVGEACGAPPDWEVPRPVTYLQSYLSGVPDRGARVLVVEGGYVDRHYLQEYTAYYATTLHPPPPHAVRVHVFDGGLQTSKVAGLLRRASAGRFDKVQRELQQAYLGYVTVRPMPSAPIGRTVLVHYGAMKARRYDPARSSHRAHVLGFELGIDALPFQQQEQAVGACATTALWSALSRAARASGGRAPTPFAVTVAATKHLVTDRDFPANAGLELSQLTGAIRELGFTPYPVKSTANSFELFMLTLKCYLRSGIPAVLMLKEIDGSEYHAVAVAGFKASEDADTVVEEEGRSVRSTGITRLYVHDDRIGPYLKMALIRAPKKPKKYFLPRLKRLPVDRDKHSGQDPDSEITCAIFPLYPKLRLTAPELIGLAGRLAGLLSLLVGAARRSRLRFECWFALNGAYTEELYKMRVTSWRRVQRFMETAQLSRYVAIIRWYLDEEVLADVVCDTTDIARTVPPYGAVLAIVMFAESFADECRKYATDVMPRAVVI
jgi:hypothetical protein